jgi:phage-related protein
MEVIYAHSKIERFILGLDVVTIERVEKVIDMLEKYGNQLGYPHSKSIGNKLFELRVVGRRQIRILYTFHENRVYIIHIFFKKTWAIPKNEIDYALKIMNQLLA